MSQDYRYKVIQQILESLFSRLITCPPADKDRLVWILKFINVFTKGFHGQAEAEIKESFAKLLQ